MMFNDVYLQLNKIIYCQYFKIRNIYVKRNYSLKNNIFNKYYFTKSIRQEN